MLTYLYHGAGNGNKEVLVWNHSFSPPSSPSLPLSSLPFVSPCTGGFPPQDQASKSLVSSLASLGGGNKPSLVHSELKIKLPVQCGDHQITKFCKSHEYCPCPWSQPVFNTYQGSDSYNSVHFTSMPHITSRRDSHFASSRQWFNYIFVYNN